MTNYQKRKAKNDEYRSRIKRFTLQFSLGDGEAREWFEQQPEQGTYLKGLMVRMVIVLRMLAGRAAGKGNFCTEVPFFTK